MIQSPPMPYALIRVDEHWRYCETIKIEASNDCEANRMAKERIDDQSYLLYPLFSQSVIARYVNHVEYEYHSDFSIAHYSKYRAVNDLSVTPT